MKNIFFNSKKAKEESDAKRRLEEETREEIAYLDTLKSDQRFQKYILEKRIKAPIALLGTIQTLGKDNLAVEVEVRKATIKALQDIFNSIMNV
jgi:hypothetical protein